MKSLFILLLLCFSQNLLASWYYNEDGGFGFYQPEGWSVQQDDRLSRMRGPAKDAQQSDFIMGSDWIDNIQTVGDLKAEVQGKYPELKLAPVEISGVPGFEVKVKKGFTEIYLLRIPRNVMVVRYILRGSKPQIDEGLDVISSIEIRTKPLTGSSR